MQRNALLLSSLALFATLAMSQGCSAEADSATTPDASTTTADASTDSSVNDASSADASDAATVDAGRVDSGMPDSGVLPDSGASDSGPNDAGAKLFPAVRTIVQTSCTSSCHSPSTGKPQGRISLESDSDIAAAHTTIAAAVTAKRMPVGGTLSAADIATIVQWDAVGGRVTD